MEFSLNEGTEKEVDVFETPSYSDLFEDPIVPGAAPEITKQNTIVASLEAQAESLSMLISDIQSVGGMNRSMALEAAKYDPSFENISPKQFTEIPTATRYKVSLESLGETLKSILKKIIELIKKSIDHVLYLITGVPTPKADVNIIKMYTDLQRRKMDWAKKASDNAEETLDLLYSEREAIIEIAARDGKLSNLDIDTVLDEVLGGTSTYAQAQRLLTSNDGIIAVLANDENLARKFYAVAGTIHSMTVHTRDKAKKLSDLILSKKFDDTTLLRTINELSTEKTFLAFGGHYAPSEAMEAVRGFMSRLPEAKPVESFSDLMRTITRSFNSNELNRLNSYVQNSIVDLAETRDAIEIIEKNADVLADREFGNKEVNDTLIRFVSGLSRDVMSLNLAISTFVGIENKITSIAYEVNRVSEVLLKRTNDLLAKEKNDKERFGPYFRARLEAHRRMNKDLPKR